MSRYLSSFFLSAVLHRKFGQLICALVVSFSVSVWAVNVEPDLDMYEFLKERTAPEGDEDKWKESDADLPPLPLDTDLVRLDLGHLSQRYTYLLDTKNLSLLDDGVLRYSLVVENAAGRRTFYREAVRCWTRERKSIAYGNAKGQWRPTKKAKWRFLKPRPDLYYHAALAQRYFCDQWATPLTVSQILKRASGEESFDYLAD